MWVKLKFPPAPKIVMTPPTQVRESPARVGRGSGTSQSRSISSDSSSSRDVTIGRARERFAPPMPSRPKEDPAAAAGAGSGSGLRHEQLDGADAVLQDASIDGGGGGKRKRRPRWRDFSKKPKILVRMLALIVIVAIVAVAATLHFVLKSRTDEKVLVDLGYATYQGQRIEDDGVDTFFGMRYAAPPTGDMRWRAPLHPLRENETVNANEFGPVCWGTGIPTGSDAQNTYSEDCLFVNVWTPSKATQSSNLAVWVFIQGGGYTQNSNANWDGTAVIKNSGYGLVFVNFNYRVGMWGFLASADVKADGDLNVGLLDQRRLLEWVQTHIAKFGGDPSRVTISGISAGAGSVALHLISHGGQDDGLYSAAISESLFFPRQPLVSEVEWQFSRLVSAVGCNSTEEAVKEQSQAQMGFVGVGKNVEEESNGDKRIKHVEGPPGGENILLKGDSSKSKKRRATATAMQCLRETDFEILQDVGNAASPFPGRNSSPLFYWTPAVDGDLIPDLPYTLFQQGKLVRVPSLFGWCTNEGSFFASNAQTADQMVSFLSDNYPGISTANESSLLELYPQLPAVPNHQAWFPSTSQAYGESTFICPSANVLSAIASAYSSNSSASSSSANDTASPSSPQVCGYQFDVHDSIFENMGLGVPHVSEAGAVYGLDSVKGAPVAPSLRAGGANEGLVPVIMGYFVSFVVSSGDPNVLRLDGSPIWQAWEEGGRGADLEARSGSDASVSSLSLNSRQGEGMGKAAGAGELKGGVNDGGRQRWEVWKANDGGGIGESGPVIRHRRGIKSFPEGGGVIVGGGGNHMVFSGQGAKMRLFSEDEAMEFFVIVRLASASSISGDKQVSEEHVAECSPTRSPSFPPPSASPTLGVAELTIGKPEGSRWGRREDLFFVKFVVAFTAVFAAILGAIRVVVDRAGGWQRREKDALLYSSD
ncbi:alpha/beta-hydrolase [Zalerion maritima]|uniref:Alpha/beta-hydrolase n=1 Tax=Zalerion maritima TaxID=339359 RepID=A0AAD5RP71_9PEZI|nr:alpha/beta-hydrolase [Zalerion maritima]